MDIVNDWLHAIGKVVCLWREVARGITGTSPAIIEVEVLPKHQTLLVRVSRTVDLGSKWNESMVCMITCERGGVSHGHNYIC